MFPWHSHLQSQSDYFSLYMKMLRNYYDRDEVQEPLPKEEATEVIMAWRAWGAEDLGRVAVLRSITRRTLWPLGEPLRAEDFGGHNGGIYAFKTDAGALHYGEEVMQYLHDDGLYLQYLWPKESKPKKTVRGIVYGRVAIWGKVIEHELGYRAEFAYPQSLIVPTTYGDDPAGIARKLGNAYGVEAIVV